ncbi:hypothetical protein GTW65_11760, partial [Streptomyces sp. SID4956]|nr:hypothetical protein [Streptomyces sp. SID4956]
LLALPWFEPLIARAEARILAVRDRLRDRRRTKARVPAPAGRPVVVRPLSEHAAAAVHEPVPAGRAARSPAYLAPGPHTSRAERSPVTPAGSRRPQHTDRHPRGTTPAPRP